MNLYNFMNGLVKKGHEVFVVTMDSYFKWDFDTYKKFLYKKRSPMKKRQLYYGKLVRSYLNSFLATRGSNIRFGKNPITQITESLTRNYEKLGVDSDILIATMTHSGEAVYKLGFGKKIVMHNQHFEEIHCTTKEEQAEISRLTRLEPFNHIVHSTWLDKMFQYYYGIKGEMITQGFNHALFTAPIDKRKYLDAKIIKIITYCDPNRPFKGSVQQISTLEKLCAKNKNIEISIFGLDPKTNRFPYKFLGWLSQEKLAKLYSESHVFVSFPWYEGLGSPPLEAMASGCVAIAGKYSTEDYLTNNHSGIIINIFNTEESAETIDKIVSNPKRMLELAINGQIAAGKFPSLETQCEKLNNFLCNLPKPKILDTEKIHSGNFEQLDRIYK